jgi:NADH-quinone oxidoreductase subunit M
MIAGTIYVTFGGAIVTLLLPRAIAKFTALLTTVAGLAIGVLVFIQTPIVDLAHFGTIVRMPWVPALGMNYHLALDGISLTLVLVTGIAAVAAVLFSWDVDLRQNEFFFWLLLVVAGSYGVFLSADLFLLFLFYELVIVPKYFLIAIWGSTNKEYGAMKLTLYSFFGGMLAFLGILAAYVSSGSLDLNQLAQFQFSPQLQAWAFPVLFLGFGVLAGIWPLHTWAPTGHVAAPTAGSMLLAGIVMKLGAYAGLRVAMNIFPQGFQVWRNAIVVLAVIGILYAAAVALRQTDLKFVIGYSSVSHMGFVLLGLATANALGVSGAVLQMFSHGVIAALLFAVAGRMIYRRTHTRELDHLSILQLNRALPFAAFTFVIAFAASIGIPGLSGFAAEITILIGVMHSFPLAAWITGIGMVLVAAFTLRAVKRSFFEGGSSSPLLDNTATRPSAAISLASSTERPIHLEPITLAEKCGACLLMFSTVAMGVYPKLLLDRIIPAVEAMRFLK